MYMSSHFLIITIKSINSRAHQMLFDYCEMLGFEVNLDKTKAQYFYNSSIVGRNENSKKNSIV